MPRHRTYLAAASVLLVAAFFGWVSIQRLSIQRLAPNSNAALHAELVRQKDNLQHALESVQAQATLHATQKTSLGTPSSTSSAAESSYAYVFYATSDAYACSVLVNLQRLRDFLKIKFPVHVLASTDVSELYLRAMQNFGATLHIQKPPPLFANAGGYYQDCLLKLLAFKMHELSPGLKRVLAFDSDQLILKNLDHLFEGLPEVDLAAPRAYWLAKEFLASTFMMINLSRRLWDTVKSALNTVAFNQFDMDLINDLLGDTVMMLSGEYVCLNSHFEDWNLPRWYHPATRFNMTLVELVNKLSRTHLGPRDWKRQAEMFEAPETSDNGHTSDRESISSTATMALPEENSISSTTVTSHIAQNPVNNKMAVPELSPPSSPRFPLNHPIAAELYRLYDSASVMHFSAVGKPWMVSADIVAVSRPDAHPLLAETFEMWREVATEVCPGGIPSGFDPTKGD